MPGVRVMLLTAIISSIMATAPASGAKQLGFDPSPNDTVKLEGPKDLLPIMQDKHSELEALNSNVRIAFHSLAEDDSLYDEDDFEGLVNAYSQLSAQAKYLKDFWNKHNHSILEKNGQDVYQEFRHIVALTGQLKKNVSGIINLMKDISGKTETFSDSQFNPTADFISAADSVTRKMFGLH